MSIIKDKPLNTALVGDTTTKLDERIAFFGMCDELSCNLMENRCLIEDETLKEELLTIVKTLSTCMGEVAGGKTKVTEDDVKFLIGLIDKYQTNNGKITEFVIPGQTLVSSHLHISRCVARRCELSYAKVYDKYNTSKIIFEYLNKISLALYFIALKYE